MDYTPSYKGNNIIASNNQYHHQQQHNQGLEWMSMMQSTTCNTTTTSSVRVDVQEEDDEGGDEGGGGNKSVIEREHMFDKVVTPSDVGKLNRLVIPKQHAEKYFPLDSSNNEKGLLLNFEDRTGKHWRFRYSYWNSSQSYVMTKGWSRFVKEKKLDAGDIVSFQRGVGDVAKDILFIDWRRRPNGLPYPSSLSGSQCQHHHYRHGRVIPGAVWGTSSPGFVLQSHPYTHQHNRYPYPPLGLQGGPSGVWDQQSSPDPRLLNVLPSSQLHQHNPVQRGPGLGSGSSSGGGFRYGYGNVVNPYPMTGSLIFLGSSMPTNNTSGISSIVQQNGRGNRASEDHHHHHCQGNGSMMMTQVKEEDGGEDDMVYESMPVVQGKATAKTLRLFGVNMDCPISHQPHDFDILSSSLASSSTPNHHPHSNYHQHNQQQHKMIPSKWGMEEQQHVTISMGQAPSSPSQSYPHSHQLRSSSSFYNETSSHAPLEKGKSSTSSPMSLDLDI